MSSGKDIKMPDLYKRRKDGKLQKWKTWTEGDILIKQDYIVGGKEKEPTRTKCKAVNVGKKNEKSAVQHCHDKAERTWISMLDKGYSPDPSDKKGMNLYEKVMSEKEKAGGINIGIMEKAKTAPEIYGEIPRSPQKKYPPMLANKWTVRKSAIDFKKGAYVQPKADGIRAIAYFDRNTRKVKLISRTGKEFKHFSHIKQELLPLFNTHQDLVLDGELYVHELNHEKGLDIDKSQRWKFIQSVCNMGRKVAHSEEIKISYYIFDVYDLDLNQEQRFNLLNYLIEGKIWDYIVLIPAVLIFDESDVSKYHNKWVNEGYEGIMVRGKKAMYLPGPTKRSEQLLKYKEFDENEFEIVGAKEGEGTEKGAVIWICETPEGKTFSCRPQGTQKERQELWKNHKKYIGGTLTVVYQGKDPATGKPRFPTGKTLNRWNIE